MSFCAMITGATGGLGRAFVFDCAKRGYNLFLSATKSERLLELKKEVLKIYPSVEINYKECDLKSEESRRELVDYLRQNNISIDMLINNAGYIFETSFLSCTDEEVLSCIKVNCEGTVDITQKILKTRNKDRKFYLLNVSSLSAYSPMPQMAIYASSKVFLLNWSIALREELKDENVNISCVCPGGMATSDAMKASIKSQGLGGKLSAEPVEKVAKISINGVLKNKAIIIPGWFNKFMRITSVLSSKKLQAKIIGRRWVKCEEKRGELK